MQYYSYLQPFQQELQQLYERNEMVFPSSQLAVPLYQSRWHNYCLLPPASSLCVYKVTSLSHSSFLRIQVRRLTFATMLVSNSADLCCTLMAGILLLTTLLPNFLSLMLLSIG